MFTPADCGGWFGAADREALLLPLSDADWRESAQPTASLQ